jgi:hypothetical protein
MALNRIVILICLCSVVQCCPMPLQAQTAPEPGNKSIIRLPEPLVPDKRYIADYHNEFTFRIFGSSKYTNYGLRDKGFAENLKYRPNSPFNVGFGFNYRILGINAGFNLPLINDTKERGKTRFLDIQSHLYGRKLIVDVYLQRYKGFYLPNTTVIDANNDHAIYIRPDISTTNFGLSVQYLLNGKRFSFRGAFLQNEVQLKSAGSPIIGASISNISVRSDSSILPSTLRYQNYFDNFQFNQSAIESGVISLGYGYTYVGPSHLFATIAASAGIGINYTSMRIRGIGSISGFGTDLNAVIRVGVGYNSRRYFAGIHYIGTTTTSSTPIIYARQQFGAGNFRISVARRFTLRRKLLGFY